MNILYKQMHINDDRVDDCVTIYMLDPHTVGLDLGLASIVYI